MKELFRKVVETEYELWSFIIFIVAVTAPVWFLFFTGFVLETLDGNSFGGYKEIFVLFIISIIGIFYTYLTYLLLNAYESIIFLVILMFFALWLGFIIVPFAIGALFWYFLAIKIFHNASNKVWWFTTIVAIIYIPFALFFGFFAGWAGLLAGGGGY